MEQDTGLKKAVLDDLGHYLFHPYYKDDENGSGTLKAIQTWNKNEKDSAYAQITTTIQREIAQL